MRQPAWRGNYASFSDHTLLSALHADMEKEILPAFHGARKLLMQSNGRGLQLL